MSDRGNGPGLPLPFALMEPAENVEKTKNGRVRKRRIEGFSSVGFHAGTLGSRHGHVERPGVALE